MEQDNTDDVVESQDLKRFHFYDTFNFGFIHTLQLLQEDADSIVKNTNQNYTLIAPLVDVEEHQKAVFDEPTQVWQILDNNYGCLVYSTQDQHSEVVNYFGAIQDGFTFNAPGSVFDTWDGTQWIDQRTDAQKQQAQRQTLVNLTARQFKLMLLEHDLTDQIEDAIAAITDKYTRRKISIEYKDASYFERNGDSVTYMLQLLNISDTLVDQYWREALNY